ncbi:hypothetical protein VTL71DRAFT_9489 [Oculimacula yallundae]|uniref:Uncharacterized protein n=1 Tax=Oculimacula yallundae TaxID=86028 RepID=A0ABR4BUT9_9HELO
MTTRGFPSREQPGFTLPDYFPPTVIDFWKLQFPSHEKELIYLLRFYQIQGYEQWGQTVDGFVQNPAGDTQDPSTSGSSSQSQSDDSDDLSPDDLSLEEATRKYPRVAIEELGPILGIVFEDIQFFRKGSPSMGAITCKTTKEYAATSASDKHATALKSQLEFKVTIRKAALESIRRRAESRGGIEFEKRYGMLSDVQLSTQPKISQFTGLRDGISTVTNVEDSQTALRDSKTTIKDSSQSNTRVSWIM